MLCTVKGRVFSINEKGDHQKLDKLPVKIVGLKSESEPTINTAKGEYCLNFKTKGKSVRVEFQDTFGDFYRLTSATWTETLKDKATIQMPDAFYQADSLNPAHKFHKELLSNLGAINTTLQPLNGLATKAEITALTTAITNVLAANVTELSKGIVISQKVTPPPPQPPLDEVKSLLNKQLQQWGKFRDIAAAVNNKISGLKHPDDDETFNQILQGMTIIVQIVQFQITEFSQLLDHLLATNTLQSKESAERSNLRTKGSLETNIKGLENFATSAATQQTGTVYLRIAKWLAKLNSDRAVI